jgi:hypothetical protein
MMRLETLLPVFLLIGLWGCSIAGNNYVKAVVPPEPKDHAWWVRIEFLPVHKQIRGIPVQQLDSSWHLASELTKEAIPKEVLYETGADIMRESEMSFSRSGDFNHDGAEDLALIGVYQDKAGKRGSFILILTKDQAGNWQKSFLRYLGKPAFAALSKNDPMEIWFCMMCDQGVHLIWEKLKGEYTIKPFPG